LYETGFETDEGFTTSTTYNNTTLKTYGPTDKQWSTICGTPSTYNTPITGSVSLQLRYYKSEKITPYATTNFTLNDVKQLKLKAKSASGSHDLAIQHTTDDGQTWSEEKTYNITTTAQEITYDLTSPTNNVRFKLSWKGTVDKKGVLIDDVVIYGVSNKTATSLTFGDKDKQTINIAKGETFTSPKAILTANGATLSGKTITYSSDNENVATVNETTGDITLVGFGTAKITADFAGDDTYAGSTSWYTINYYDPANLDVTFDFTNPSLYGYGVSSSSSNAGDLKESGGTIISGIVTITSNSTNGSTHNRFWDGDLRVYEHSSLTFSVPAGYIITQIEFSTSSDKVSADKGTLSGKTWTGTETSVKFEYTGTVKYTSATVSVKKVPLIDENSQNIIVASGEITTVSLIRTLDNTDWNTFCVPFDITEEQITEVFGEGTKITDFTSADETKNVMNFTTVTSIKAGEPYLIKPGKEKVENPTFSNVTIAGGEPKTVTYGGYSFVGVYSPYAMKTDGTEVFIGTGGKLFVPAETTNKIKGMRAYIRLSNAAQGKMSTISIDGEGTTGISITEKNDMKGNGNVYNINGQLVGKSTTGLKSGIYIVNGKKVIIK